MLVKIKNHTLFLEWMTYLSRKSGKCNFEERTFSFIHSQNGIAVPNW